MAHVSIYVAKEAFIECCSEINNDSAKPVLVKFPLKDIIVISKKRGSCKHERLDQATLARHSDARLCVLLLNKFL